MESTQINYKDLTPENREILLKSEDMLRDKYEDEYNPIGIEQIRAIERPGAFLFCFRHDDSQITRDYYGNDLGGPDDYVRKFKKLALVVDNEIIETVDVGFYGYQGYYKDGYKEAVNLVGGTWEKYFNDSSTIDQVREAMDKLENHIENAMHGNIQGSWQEPAELEVTGITLLSVEEAEKMPEKLCLIGDWWWLRSPGHYAYTTADVGGFGHVDTVGNNVDSSDFGIRPALKISNLESLNLAEGDEIEVADHTWTVIPGSMALCNDIIGACAFRAYEQFSDDGKTFLTHDGKEHPIEELNSYEHSDAKAFIEDWAIENGILTPEQVQNKNTDNIEQDEEVI